MAEVKILTSGVLATLQDQGRFGFGQYGVPQSGAMDQVAYRLANHLLGNQNNEACIEWAFRAPVLQFSEDTEIVLTGAIATTFINDKKVGAYRKIKIYKNDVLRIDFCKTGVYGYIGVKGGFLSPMVLKSRSFYKSISPQWVLKKNDAIPYRSMHFFENHFSTISTSFDLQKNKKLPVYKGAEFNWLSDTQKSRLLDDQFTISNAINRMAIQLEERLPNSLPSMLTGPVLPGTVQMTPSGMLMVLMRDCQTTGGYPRVLQLSEEAINMIAQKRMKETFAFELVE
ncbi:5-oxoprolinase subunit C family protein [Aquimarina pacifica]|uniref:5-oxoprolinase subunit C family protein n=1 Tax=Aquimarina pacifica TaxID=1296415 RepID=UPI0004722201|nr:biotin-dependent carboxyltransferase family protein [Aquimarina pacifica]